MKTTTDKQRPELSLPVLPSSGQPPRRKRNYARWRAISLSLVYLVFAAHIAHWKITGKTLAPLELNEVMYTLELGIVTAGFLFMCFLVLGTLIFGRFFCSWACHIMVLQDLCSWILRKLRIRPKPLRSRLLLLVPPLTAAYMFIWPQIVRTLNSGALPTFHFATDADGWASFVTNNFWRNLPGPTVIILTFLVCGFAIVYVLGSRSFCTYVCPYGAVFALADRFSPGRIVVNDSCEQCGQCTAACTSGIRVHEEVKEHGMIVNADCLKDFDCISTCPNEALRYTFAIPALFKSRKTGGRFGSLPYDFSMAEELLCASVFVVTLLSLRGLYSRVPFLMSLACGAILGYFAVLAVRLVTRPSLQLVTWRLKRLGRLTGPGYGFVTTVVLLAAFMAHSGFVRFHEFTGLRATVAFQSNPKADNADALAQSAFDKLLTADRWGLFGNSRLEQGMTLVATQLGKSESVRHYAERYLHRYPDNIAVNLRLVQAHLSEQNTEKAEEVLVALIDRWASDEDGVPLSLSRAHQTLGGLLAARGEYSRAASELSQTLALDGNLPEVHAELGGVLAELRQFDAAVQHLSEAVRLNPQLADAHYNLGTILGHMGRFEEAIPHYRQALKLAPNDAALHNNLGYALRSIGRLDESKEQFEYALADNPNNADAHFNLGAIYAARHDADLASEHFNIAVRLDPRYARLLNNTETE